MKRLIFFVAILRFIIILALSLKVILVRNVSKTISIVTPTPTPFPGSILLTPRPLNADKLMALVNEWRVSEGYQSYGQKQELCLIAQDRVKDGDDDHAGFMKKIKSGYYSFMPDGVVLQENSVWNVDDEHSALGNWLGSPPHRETLEKPYKYSCIAVQGQNAVQIFSNF